VLKDLKDLPDLKARWDFRDLLALKEKMDRKDLRDLKDFLAQSVELVLLDLRDH